MSGGLVLISDLHVANRKAFGKLPVSPTFKGCNTRLHNILNYLTDVYEFAIATGCEAVVILGDVFHERGIINVPVYNALYSVLNDYKTTMRTLMFPGNHDFIDSRALWGETGYSSLYCLSEVAHVIHKPADAELEYFDLCMIPFNISADETISASKRLMETWSDKIHLLLLHHSIAGASFGPSNWQMPTEIKPSDIPDDYFHSFSGHIHKHQTLEKKVTYVGAPLQHDLGERNYTPGFIYVRPSGSWEHVENTTSPRFVAIEADTEADLKGLDPKNYNVVTWRGDTAMGEKIKQNEDLLVDINPRVETLVKRTSIAATDNMTAMMQKYVNARFGEDKPEVLKYGIDLYNGDK